MRVDGADRRTLEIRGRTEPIEVYVLHADGADGSHDARGAIA
jgi:hypothetical protein